MAPTSLLGQVYPACHAFATSTVLLLARSRDRRGGPPPISILQHTSAYVRLRQHTAAYVSIRQHTAAYGAAASSIGRAGTCYTSTYVSIRMLHVNIREHTYITRTIGMMCIGCIIQHSVYYICIAQLGRKGTTCHCNTSARRLTYQHT